ncbi:putative serine/threonine protein kinase [Kitasatospora cheerisanensis KCTC 2395]|uniref:Putative serine/threonine protein kinase n=1 Tax=Kitasatospora cheerisanensis KCTC 2395 TaxID=1348663 RepID=A0A066YQI1_9ACTN|nr:putative serine/threonine protein kinase [Kitasatospora cheerisanensis KCTC 2395]
MTARRKRGRGRVRASVAAAAVLLGAAFGGLAAAGKLPWQDGAPGKGTAADGEALPQAFLGTWRGTITTKVVPLPSTFTATFTAGRIGEDVGRTSNASAFSSTVCRGVLTLLSVEAGTVTLQERPEGPQAGCSEAREKQTYTVLDGGARLHVAVTGAQLGTDPEGDLAKQ